MGCHSDCREAFCDHGGCMGCGHDSDCCPDCAMPNADQRACLTLEYRDNVCEHCLGPTNDPTAPHYYDHNHRAASGTPAGYVGAWAIWCGRPCGDDCAHEGQMNPLVRDTKREERLALEAEPCRLVRIAPAGTLRDDGAAEWACNSHGVSFGWRAGLPPRCPQADRSVSP